MKNKGIIGIGLILAIVLGVAVVGGGAYYLGKSKEVKNTENILPAGEEQNLPIAENPQTAQVSTECVSTSQPFVKVLSPNGGESYNRGQEVSIKWTSCNVTENVFIALHKDGEWKDVISLTNSTINDGNETLAFAAALYPGSYKIRIGTASARVQQDFSDNLFTINSSSNSEESTTEVFTNQPGDIKSIATNGTNSWVLAVDLLSRNPNWIPGVDSSGPFFLNQNTQIRNLNLTNSTKVYNCGEGPDNNPTTADVIISNSDFVKDIQSSEYKKRYFDINRTNIVSIYQQCLP